MNSDHLQSGIHPVLYTFFNSDGTVDTGAIRAEVDWTIARGANGVVALGIASEVAKLDVEERRLVLQTVSKAIDGRVPLAVTVAEPSVPGQIEFARLARDAGADWLILQSPQVRVSEAVLVEFTAQVAESTELPCAVQSNPGNMDVALSNAALLELNRRCSNIRLLKAEGMVISVAELAQKSEMAVFGGRNGLELVGALVAGLAGNVPAPELTGELVRVYELASTGETDALEQARRLHASILPLIVFLNHNLLTQVCYGKRLLAHRAGIGQVYDRLPALPPTPFGLQEMHTLFKSVENVGVRH